VEKIVRELRFATAILKFSKRRGGAERYLIDLCHRMAGEGCEVNVFAEDWEEGDDGIHFHRIRLLPFPRSLRLLGFAIQATRGMEGGNYDITMGVGNILRADVLQPHGGVHWAWFWRSLQAYEHPVWWTMKFLGRILSPKQWLNGWIEDAPYRSRAVRRIVAISDMVKRDIVRWYGVPEDRITTVYNGVDVERFHPRNRSFREEIRRRHGIGEEVVILFVSNNFRMKGLEYLMRAMASLKEGDHASIKLLVLGRDRQDRYLRLAKKTGLWGEVIFAGSTDEPEKYYGAADLLVHPSFYDACSLTVLEALASGLPVITTTSNGASGIITSGQEGFVISNPRETHRLVEKISFFLDPETLQRASVAARRLAEDHSLERNWREMKDILQSTLPKRGQ
jgi:UDP-glucose:(heptosyl)LPS alpha-1,3-glucosyltransferase